MKSLTRTECAMRLLSEFNDICNKKKIRYVVGGIPARAALEKKKLVFPCMDIFVEKRKMPKIRKLMESCGPDRVAESGFVNGYPAIRYVDTMTTFIDSMNMDEFRAKGIYLQIMPIEAAGIEKKDLKSAVEYPWENHKIRMPEDSERYYRLLFERGGSKVFPGYPNARCIVSTTVPYERILSKTDCWEAVSKNMRDCKLTIDEANIRIDKRTEVIEDVMGRVRKLYENSKSTSKEANG